MKHHQIRLGSPEGVKAFVNAATQTPCEVQVTWNRTIVDGKSVLSMFSLPMNEPVTIHVNGSDEECERFLCTLEPFLLPDSAERRVVQ